MIQRLLWWTSRKPRSALRVACNALGLKEVPNGSNTGPEIYSWVGGYNEYWKIGDTVDRPWCVHGVRSPLPPFTCSRQNSFKTSRSRQGPRVSLSSKQLKFKMRSGLSDTSKTR